MKRLLLLFALWASVCCFSQTVDIKVGYQDYRHVVDSDDNERFTWVENDINGCLVYFIDTVANEYYMCKVKDSSISVPLLLWGRNCIIVFKNKRKHYASSCFCIDSTALFNKDGWVFHLNESNEWLHGLTQFYIKMEGTNISKGLIHSYGGIFRNYSKDRSKYFRYGRKLVRKAKRHGKNLFTLH